MLLDFSSYLKNIDRFLKDGHLAKACFEYSQAPGPVQRYLKNIYGLLITGGLPSERALSRTKYPAVLANKITRDFELLIEIVPKSRSNFYQWPEHLKQIAQLALKQRKTEVEQLHLSFFPPVKIGHWLSNAVKPELTIDLGDQSDSYSAAVYVALRRLIEFPHLSDDIPYTTGCYEHEKGLLVPPSDDALRQKCQSFSSELMTPKKDESPDEFYRRCYSKTKSRSLAEINRDLRNKYSLSLSECKSLLDDTHNMIKQGKDKQYFSKSVCQELYCEYITLASHIDQLNSIDHSVYTMMESCLKDDLEFFVRYVCIRLNKDLHQIKPKQALETAQTLMSRLSNLPNLPILPMKLHESELRTYPVSYCYLWNTLALVMASNGEVDKALGLVKLAVKRTLLNEYSSLADLVRYNCRLGQILSVSGQSAEAIEVLKEVIKSLDDQAMVSDQQLETTRIFVYIYLARALAHQGLASEANHYYRLSEQMGGGAVELLFAKFEIRFLLSIYHYEDYQSVCNDWLHEQSKLESEIRQLHKYTIDRVKTVAVFTNFLIQQEKSISAEDLVDLSKIYKNQYIEHGHCAVF